MFDYIKLFFKGIVLGVSNVIPGVSGGTMAVVFNVYDRIIALITPNIKKILGEWKFWLPLGIGMGAGILAFSRIITKLLEVFPNPTSFFFIGLILGSVPLILRKIKSSISATSSNSQNEKKSALFFASLAVFFLAGIFAVLSMLLFGDADSAKEIAKENATLSSLDAAKAAMLFASGVAAAVAMIIPGISGSFLLLAMGMYGEIMGAISTLNILFLIPFAAGVLLGIIGGAALVRILMKKIPAQTYSAILGLVAGSIVLIFPGLAPISVLIFSIFALALGFCAAYFSSRKE